MTATMAQAIASTLAEALEHDASVIVLGEQVGRSGGIAGTCRGLLDRFGPERVLDLPVADHGNVGFAVGLALGGKRPVVELTGTGRLAAALEILAEAASVAEGEFAAPVVVRVPFGGEAGARIDRPVGELLAAVPGLHVVCPANPGQAAGLLRAALHQRAPVVILEPRALYGARGGVGEGRAPLGHARVLREGEHVTLAAYGAGVAAAIEAAEALVADGVTADVIDLVSLSPVDAATLGARARATGRLVVAHGGDEGLGARILRVALTEAFEYLEAPPAVAADGGLRDAALASVHF